MQMFWRENARAITKFNGLEIKSGIPKPLLSIVCRIFAWRFPNGWGRSADGFSPLAPHLSPLLTTSHGFRKDQRHCASCAEVFRHVRRGDDIHGAFRAGGLYGVRGGGQAGGVPSGLVAAAVPGGTGGGAPPGQGPAAHPRNAHGVSAGGSPLQSGEEFHRLVPVRGALPGAAAERGGRGFVRLPGAFRPGARRGQGADVRFPPAVPAPAHPLPGLRTELRGRHAGLLRLAGRGVPRATPCPRALPVARTGARPPGVAAGRLRHGGQPARMAAFAAERIARKPVGILPPARARLQRGAVAGGVAVGLPGGMPYSSMLLSTRSMACGSKPRLWAKRKSFPCFSYSYS